MRRCRRPGSSAASARRIGSLYPRGKAARTQVKWLIRAVPGTAGAVLTTLCLVTPASAATFCVQKLDCPGTFENNLSDALSAAHGTAERDRIELGAYID